MKFKEIKPGMVIHCPKEEDASALLEHLEEIGYEWFPSGKLTENTRWERYQSGTLYCIALNNKTIVLGNLYYEGRPSFARPPIEFSDLIEPDFNAPNTSSNALKDKSNTQMSAIEVLEWIKKNGGDISLMKSIFGDGCEYCDDMFDMYLPKEILRRITAYEAAKKKPVEVEFGWKCEIFRQGEYATILDEREMWDGDEVNAMDEAAERARQYAAENGEQVYFRVYGICRVKEDA